MYRMTIMVWCYEEMKKELIAGFQNEEDFAYMKGYKPWKKLLAKY